MATVAAAQEATPGQPQQPAAAAATADDADSRLVTTTFLGDTGLWFVPTADVLPARRWSASAYYINFDYQQGFTDVSNFLVTGAVGLRDRAELFGSFRVVTRIDRDIRPIFTNNRDAGGLVNEYPLVDRGWTGNQVGDLYLGGKVNLLSEYRQHPVAMALRGVVKLPTGDDEAGAGSGAADFLVDAIVSKEVNRKVELTGFGGLIFRGDPTDIDLANGFRWGVGVGGPTRGRVRVFSELHGEAPWDDVVIQRPQITDNFFLVGPGGSLPPIVSDTYTRVHWTSGVTVQMRNGLFLGAAAKWDLMGDPRSDFGPYSDEGGDYFSLQFRLGYHPGARVYVAPPPPPPPPPPAPQNRPPTVKAHCKPCTVEVGNRALLWAEAQDPDGDTLNFMWSAPAGNLLNPSERETLWVAPNQEGTVPATVTVRDGRGGTATDTVTLQVVRPAVKTYTFEDVHFDFDRYSLRPQALEILAEAVKAMRENNELRLVVEGHTCNIGTAEYNLALGERRAHAVRDYMIANGIGADRLATVSYGEERPKHSNEQEQTRRLNRRAALVVKVQ